MCFLFLGYLERVWPVFLATGFGMGTAYMECRYGFSDRASIIPRRTLIQDNHQTSLSSSSVNDKTSPTSTSAEKSSPSTVDRLIITDPARIIT